MRQLTKLQLLAFYFGGLLLVVGILIPIFSSNPTAAPYVYTVGAVLFAAMQFLQSYEGQSVTIRRLRRQQLLGAIALVVTGGFMFCSLYGIRPFRGSEWQMTFAIGAILEVYTAFRIPAAISAEQSKEERKRN